MTKKIYSLILSGLLCVGVIGCGPSDDTSNEVKNSKTNSSEYDLLVWEDQGKSNGIEEAIKKFEQQKNVKIKVVEKTYANQIEDLRLDGPAGTGPDVITIPGDQIGVAVTSRLLKELDIDESTKDIYTESAMESQIVNGKVYGLPKAVETQILYYNKDIITEDELPETTDEWLEYSKSAIKEDRYGLLALWDQIYYAQGVMSGFDGYIFGKKEDGSFNADDIGLNNEGSIKGAEYISEFYKSGVFPKGIIGEQGISTLDSLFTEGKAAAVISGPWNIEPYKSAGINYGVKALPKLPNGENMSSLIGVKSYNVSTYSKNPELAEELVEFLANEENSKTRYEITKEVPAIKSLADDELIVSEESSKAVAEQSQYAELTPGITEMNSVWEQIDSALQTIATQKSNPKEALDNAVNTIKNTISAIQK